MALLALTGLVSAAQNYEVSIGTYIPNLAGRSFCNSTFYIGNLCGFYIIGFTVLAIWIMYCVSLQLPSDGIIMSTSLWIIVLGDPVVGLLPYGLVMAMVLLSGVALYKIIEKLVTTF